MSCQHCRQSGEGGSGFRGIRTSLHSSAITPIDDLFSGHRSCVFCGRITYLLDWRLGRGIWSSRSFWSGGHVQLSGHHWPVAVTLVERVYKVPGMVSLVAQECVPKHDETREHYHMNNHDFSYCESMMNRRFEIIP